VLILRHYAGACEARFKTDASPVTAADEEAEALILARLASIAPGIPVIAEEAMAAGRSLPHDAIAGHRFFLVDPLDGTKEFLKRNGEFTVNIALIEGGRARMGVVLAPAKARLFLGDGENGAFACEARADAPLKLADARAIKARVPPAQGLTLLASRSHGDGRLEAFCAELAIAERIDAGSSLKFCLIAAGEADLYPRLGPTMEWDTAAGQAVLEAAGGTVMTEDGAPLAYGKTGEGFRNPHFTARGRTGLKL
jgi:3'(2'),5'-bisphosphate nucleotidase